MSVMEKQVVEVQEKLEDITECPICTETFKEPKMLPCIHTFCMICLLEAGLKTSKSPGNRMPCPVCRTEFTVPEIGFSGLQRNFFMERLIEMKNILNPSSTRVVCDACQEDNDLGAEAEIPSAAMYCADCNQRLCEECCKNHRKYKISKGHRMLSLDGSQINIPSIVKPYVCDKHENKALEIYCLSCQEVICALCFYKSHKAHDTSPVIEVVTDYRKIIQENADSMMKLLLDLKQKTAGKDNAKEMFTAKVTDVESEIKTIKQKVQACAKRDCNSLLLQLKSVKEERIKQNEIQLCDIETAIASLESYQAYCRQVTSIGSDVDICRAVQNLSTRAAELKQRYESVSLQPFPDIRLKKTEFHDALYQTGKSIIGKIEEFGDDQALQAESKESVIDRISSLVNEVDGILDKISDKVEQSKETEQILEHSDLRRVEADDESKHIGKEEHQNFIYGMKKGRSVAFARIAVEEMKESMTCVDKLSNKLKETKIKINILLKRYDKLTKEMGLERENASKLLEENRVLCDQAELIKLTRMKSDQEIIDLRKQVALLTSIAYDGDKTPKGKNALQQKSGLSFLQTFTAVDVPVTNEARYRITGLAILDNELFVANSCNIVEVNDLRTLKFKRRWRAEQLPVVQHIADMKASERNKYVYLLCNSMSDTRSRTEEVHMLRYSAGGKVINKWKLDSVKGAYAQISITGESNVLLTDGFGSKLIEYSPDGKLMRAVSLKWEAGIQHLTHAVKLTSDHFLVCHGEAQDSLQRVCIIDIDGNVLKYFGEVGKSNPFRPNTLHNPVYLEMAANGNILVADHSNRRLLVLSSNLEFMQELNPHNSKYSSGTLDRSISQSKPRKLILDEANGRLFVAENIWKVPSDSDYDKQYGDQLSAFTFSMQ